ncbi:MAG TPA: GIY-YIG nuclease family protein [Lentimicrobium sp.]|nr:GIY-YIG nuclease family protein [Lentimicrobium sp.]
MYYIYILNSERSDLYYIGYTDNVQRRLAEHNTSPRNTFTSKHRPWKIKAVFIATEDIGTTIKIERFIKRQKSRSFIDKLCNLDLVDLPLAQLVRVPQLRD